MTKPCRREGNKLWTRRCQPAKCVLRNKICISCKFLITAEPVRICCPYPCSAIRTSSNNISISQEFSIPYTSWVFNALNADTICIVLLEKSDNRSTSRTFCTTHVWFLLIKFSFSTTPVQHVSIQVSACWTEAERGEVFKHSVSHNFTFL